VIENLGHRSALHGRTLAFLAQGGPAQALHNSILALRNPAQCPYSSDTRGHAPEEEAKRGWQLLWS
jgi:hypothetical protein